MFLGQQVLTLFLFVQFSTVSCDTFYIVTSSSSPCPEEYIGVPCLTLQQYASNPSRSQNITLLVEPGMYSLSTILMASNSYNFTMASTNATVTCTSATAQFEFNTVENVHISGITFQGCRNTAIRMLQVTSASIVSCNFIDNQVFSGSRSGGCFYITTSSVIISESEFFCDNQAISGGCFYITSSSVTISESEFHSNQASYAGCFYITSSSLTIRESEFYNNRGSSGSGGCLYITSSFVIFSDIELCNNRAYSGGASSSTV